MKFIKQHTLTFLFILSIFLLSSCAKKVYTTIGWQATSVTVDGKPKEWEIPLRYYDDKSKLQFVYTNDSKNLYICIRSTDNTVTNKILRAGMQIWIDTTGQKVEATGVMFPLIQHAGVKHSQGQSGGQTGQGTGQQSGQQTGQSGTLSSQTAAANMVKDQHQMQLMGFRAPIGGFTPINNEFGIQAAMAVDSLGILFYELAVPFATFYHPLSATDTVKNFSIEIVINELQKEGGSGTHSGSGGGGRGGGMSGGGGMGGGMGGGGMRGGGGGMRGGGGNRNQDENSEANEKTSLWRYIKVSYK